MGVCSTSCSGKLPVVTEMSFREKRQEEKISSSQTETSANMADDAERWPGREFMTISRPKFRIVTCQRLWCLNNSYLISRDCNNCESELKGTLGSCVIVTSQRPVLTLATVVLSVPRHLTDLCGCDCLYNWVTFVSSLVMDWQTGLSVRLTCSWIWTAADPQVNLWWKDNKPPGPD